ncbi:rRNA biogenesis protein rrp5 [Epicoccum nigrum]|nr:rRNA biogenesis protein rrp5 [Epicoccum nigrum]
MLTKAFKAYDGVIFAEAALSRPAKAQGLGVFFELGVLSENTSIHEPDTKHRSRVIGCNAFDDLFQLSLEKKVLEQAVLRIEDIKAGQGIKGKVHKLIGDEKGEDTCGSYLTDKK